MWCYAKYLIGHFKRGDDGLDGGDLALVEEDEGVLVLHLDEISTMVYQLSLMTIMYTDD